MGEKKKKEKGSLQDEAQEEISPVVSSSKKTERKQLNLFF